MKKILSLCTAIVVVMQSFGVLPVLAEKTPEYIYMDISEFYNATVYADKDVALGEEKGSSLYFVGKCTDANLPLSGAGNGIEKSYFKNKIIDGVLTTSGKSKFQVNTEGGVILGSNGFTRWEIPVDNSPYSIDFLTFAVNNISSEIFSAQVYYEDGTVEEDHGLSIKAYSVDSGDSVLVQTVKPVTGQMSEYGYLNVVSLELKNQYTKTKKVSKIIIEQNTKTNNAAYLAMTLRMTPAEYDYSNSVVANISDYCNGEYMASYEDQLQHKYSGFMHNTTTHINYDYLSKYTDENNEFNHNGVTYKFAEKEQLYKGIYSYIEDDYKIELPLEENYYSKICIMINASSYTGEEASGEHSRVTDVPVTIDYADGTSSETTIDVGYASGRAYYNKSSVGFAPAIIAGTISNNIDWGGTGELLSKTVTEPSDFSTGFIYAVEIPVEEEKAVTKISIGSENKRVYLYALTGVKKETTVDLVNSAIADLISGKKVYDSMYADVKMIRILIDELGSESGILNYNEFIEIEEELNNRLANKGCIEIFVSEDGSDENSGSESSPIKTFQKAKDMVARNRGVLELGIDIHVLFDEGEYINENGFKLDVEDGTDIGKIYYKGKKENVNFRNTTELDKADFSLVTDSTVLEKIPDVARGKVYAIDLDDYSVTVPEYGKYVTPQLFADNKAQVIAKYPNNGYTSVKANVEKADYPENYPYTGFARNELYEEEHSDWAEAKYAYAEGYFKYDYNYQKLPIAGYENDTNILTVVDEKAESSSPAIDVEHYPTKPRRIRIVNLIEELDVPGEWYYDKDENEIYWYPENFDAVQKVMVTTNESAVFTVDGAENVTLENINVCGSAGNGIEILNTSKVSVKGCDIADISQRAISAENCTDTIIDSNVIHNSALGIVLKSGDFEKLTSCGNVITNNHIYNIGYGKVYGRTAAVDLRDTGCEVSHNTIHDMPDNAIRYSGNDNKFLYNEIYNVCSEVNDGSAIYSGRKYIERGCEIAYNYIHDLVPGYNWSEGNEREGEEFQWCYGIYFDDGLSGQKAYKNIFESVPAAFNINCGQQNEVYDNIIVNTTSDKVFTVTSYGIGSADRVRRETIEWEGLNEAQKEIYSSKYKGIADGYITYPASPANNTVVNNLISDCNGEISITKENVENGGRFDNNIVKNGEDYFCNVKYGDYRIKRESDILEELPGILSEDTLKFTDFGTELIDNSYEHLIKFEGYEFIDISSVANTIGFLQTGVTYLDEESGIRYSQISTVDENGEISYESTGKAFTAENYIGIAKKRVGTVDYYNVVNLDQYNAEAVEAKKVDGYLYDENNIPFDIKTSLTEKNIIQLSADGNGSRVMQNTVTIPIEKGNYSEFYFLMDSVNDVSADNFKLTVNYTDGTTDVDPDWGIKGHSASETAFNSTAGVSSKILIECAYNEDGTTKKDFSWIYRTDIEGSKNVEYPLNMSYYMPVYKVEVDPSKTVESITATNSTSWGTAIILSATGVRANDTNIANVLVEKLVEADSITVDNYFDYADELATIFSYIEKGAELTAENQSKFDAVKSVIESFASRYEIFDISGVANMKAFGTTGVVTDYEDYIGRDGEISRVLNQKAFEYFKKSDGNIYAYNGVPFRITTNKDKNVFRLGGYAGAPTSVTIDVPDGNYSSIYFPNTGINSVYMNNFKVTVTYTDGTTTVTDSSMNKIAEPVYTKPTEYPVNVSSYIGCFGDDLNRNDPENTAMFYKLNATAPFVTTYWIPVFEVKLDPTKTVKNVTFSGGSKSSGCSILGVTATVANKEEKVDYALEKIADTSVITLDTFGLNKNYLTIIEQYGIDNLSEEELATYNAAKTVVDGLAVDCEVYDISASFTEDSVVYAMPGVENTEWADCEKFLNANSSNGYSSVRAYNKEKIEGLKATNGGYLYAGNIPFDVNTNGAVITGGLYGGIYQTIEINAENCVDKLAVLADYSYGPRGVIGRVNYTDGTVEEYVTFNSNNYPNGEYGEALFIGDQNSGSIGITDLRIKDAEGTVDTTERMLYTYEINVLNNKIVKSIEVKAPDIWSGFVILAVTGVDIQIKTNTDILDEYVEMINAGTATKADIDAAYQLLRATVKSGELPAIKFYSDIIDAKAEYGVVTINDVEWNGNTMTANINGSDDIEGQEYVLLLAVYEGNKLSEVKTVSTGTVLLTNEGVDVSKTLETDITGKTVKCFAIDSFAGMKPVSEVIVK